VLQDPSLFLGQDDDLTGPFGEALKHGLILGSGGRRREPRRVPNRVIGTFADPDKNP
jgi:hypothetical protein